MSFNAHIILAHKLWKELLLPGDNAIDATLGNGLDTLFLAQFLEGKIFCFDIQKVALDKAKVLLEKQISLDKILFFNKSHEDFSFIKEPIKLIVYNLGYLPKGDKTITTKSSSTLKSIKNALEIVLPKGAISITTYCGHSEGALEKEALLKFLATVDPKKFQIVHHEWINKKNSPSLIWIKKN